MSGNKRKWRIEVSLKGAGATMFFAILSSALLIGAALGFQWIANGPSAVKEVLNGMSVVVGYCGLVAALFLTGVFIVEWIRQRVIDSREGVYMPYPKEADCDHEWHYVEARDGLEVYAVCQKCGRCDDS